VGVVDEEFFGRKDNLIFEEKIHNEMRTHT